MVLTRLSLSLELSASTATPSGPSRLKSRGSKRGGRKQKPTGCAQQSDETDKILHATIEDDIVSPLILLKIFDLETVDMLFLGAAPFDYKMCIHDVRDLKFHPLIMYIYSRLVM